MPKSGDSNSEVIRRQQACDRGHPLDHKASKRGTPPERMRHTQAPVLHPDRDYLAPSEQDGDLDDIDPATLKLQETPPD